jgi:hypothetical protein
MGAKKGVIYEFAKMVNHHGVYLYNTRWLRGIHAQLHVFWAHKTADLAVPRIRHHNDPHVPFLGCLYRP